MFPELSDLFLSLSLSNLFDILGALDEEEGRNVVGEETLKVKTPNEESRQRRYCIAERNLEDERKDHSSRSTTHSFP